MNSILLIQILKQYSQSDLLDNNMLSSLFKVADIVFMDKNRRMVDENLHRNRSPTEVTTF
jgi:hypothetical protein